ncbi:MAG: hypothetical protein E2600_13805 [Chryseobacterium sp.]|nr:hypothetical protein [Chryseobacterium sp.]
MYILIEGEYYATEDLQKVFEDMNFYSLHGSSGKINSVGYYHSLEKNSLALMLPKVFMKDAAKTIFGLSPQELFISQNGSVKQKTEYSWVRKLSMYFYNSLKEFRNRFPDSVLINYSDTFELRNTSASLEYSYLDILLSIINFYRKNSGVISFNHIKAVSGNVNKARWEKTILKNTPVLTGNGTFFYPDVINSSKVLNSEEELIIYFLSIVNHLSREHSLHIHIEKYYPLITGQKFASLQKNGISKLKKIKYRYFSDLFKNMYRLCEMYFSLYDKADIKKRKQDFLVTSSYNIIFEDMIDKLFSEDMKEVSGYDGITLNNLKRNDDGKRIDHIFDYRSLIDTSDIFYIGDSKYYQSDRTADALSRYKQFTYAKNIIQYNINLLHDNESYSPNMRYRDPVTEGYNITPNFFIYGYIDNADNYNLNELIPMGEPFETKHFEHRLFDRDTLFVHQYKINFLFVLKSYTSFTGVNIHDFRKDVKELFRKHFVDYFNTNREDGYKFYKITKTEGYEELIKNNFKILNGKAYVTVENEMLLAKHYSDDSLTDFLSEQGFEEKMLE